jgi:SAM-dependent methyltransferase
VDITTFTSQYFAELAEIEAHHPWTSAMRALTLALIAREAENHPGRTRGAVLDVGCGAGLFLNEWLAGSEAAVGVGVDLSADALGWARRRDLGTWVRASAGDLPFAPASFDAIHSADVLQHLSFDDAARAFELFASLLAPGGILALRVRAPRIFQREPDVDYSQAFSRRRLRTELESRGFTIRFLSHVNAVPSLKAEIGSMFSRATVGNAVKGIQNGSASAARSRLLAAYLAVERAWLLASRLPLPAGHTMICIARRR